MKITQPELPLDLGPEHARRGKPRKSGKVGGTMSGIHKGIVFACWLTSLIAMSGGHSLSAITASLFLTIVVLHGMSRGGWVGR